MARSTQFYSLRIPETPPPQTPSSAAVGSLILLILDLQQRFASPQQLSTGMSAAPVWACLKPAEAWEFASPVGRRMAGLRLQRGASLAFSGAAPTLLRSIAALSFTIQAAEAELLKETFALLIPRLCPELAGICLCHVVHHDEILLEAPEAMAPASRPVASKLSSPWRLRSRWGEPELVPTSIIFMSTCYP